jgi:hypothetical protein
VQDPSAVGEAPFYEVEVDATQVRVTRTARRYELVSQVRPSFDAIDDELRTIDPEQCSLLIDLRRIVGRNDPEFEAELAPMRRELLGKFGRAALLVRTAIGKLQLERYLSSDGIEATVFSDEDEAEQWLGDGA